MVHPVHLLGNQHRREGHMGQTATKPDGLCISVVNRLKNRAGAPFGKIAIEGQILNDLLSVR